MGVHVYIWSLVSRCSLVQGDRGNTGDSKVLDSAIVNPSRVFRIGDLSRDRLDAMMYVAAASIFCLLTICGAQLDGGECVFTHSWLANWQGIRIDELCRSRSVGQIGLMLCSESLQSKHLACASFSSALLCFALLIY